MPDSKELHTIFSVSLPLDLYNKLKKRSIQEGFSFSYYFVHLLKKGIEIYEKELQVGGTSDT